MNDEYLFFWQFVAMLDTFGERLTGSEHGRLLLYEKFSVFPTTLPSNRVLFLQMFKKLFKGVFFHHFVGNSFFSFFAV